MNWIKFCSLGFFIGAFVAACGGSESETVPGADSAVEDVVETVIDDDGRDAEAGSEEADDYSVEFVEGAPIPPEFPKDLPLPEGAELRGAFDSPTGEAIELTLPGKPAGVLRSLEAKYLDEGWDITGSETNARGEGMILATKGDRSVMTLVLPGEDGGTLVQTVAIAGVIPE